MMPPQMLGSGMMASPPVRSSKDSGAGQSSYISKEDPEKSGGATSNGMRNSMMASGLYPGQATIAVQDVPNISNLDSRPLPPVPMPWHEKTYLAPGMPTGICASNFNPLQEREIGNIPRKPHTYKLNGFGPRDICWAAPMPVAERNPGIMVNAEFPLEQHMEGREVVHYDLAVRNLTWAHQGPWVKPFDPFHDVPKWDHKLYGEYEMAKDMVEPCVPGALKRHHQDFGKKTGENAIEQYYRKLHENRDLEGKFAEDKVANRHFKLEILNEQDMKSFWADKDAIESNWYD
jgi:hypothetical protein